jgi:hypothetical protein
MEKEGRKLIKKGALGRNELAVIFFFAPNLPRKKSSYVSVWINSF